MVMHDHVQEFVQNPSLQDILHVDTWARQRVQQLRTKVNNVATSSLIR